MRRQEKKGDSDKHTNYKNLITQYYNKDPLLSDAAGDLKRDFPEIQILETLNSFEKKLDGLIKTKRYDVQEMFIKPSQKLKRVLRVHLIFEKQETEDTLKIIGALHPPKAPDAHNIASVPRLTSFFKQIAFFYAGESQPFVTWKKPTSNFAEQDGIQLKLPKTREQSTITVKFTLISNPPKFQVENSLQRIVGMKKGTRIEILDAFWQYIKENKLQDIENKQIINCDQTLKATFKTEKFAFATVNNRVRELLTPVDPTVLQIKPTDTHRVFDFIVEIEERPDIDIVPFFAQKISEERVDHPYMSLHSKIKKYDKKFQDHSEKLRRHLAKKELYDNFTPEKIEDIISQQHQLLKILRKRKPNEESHKLEFVLSNEDEVEREIKHYYEQLNASNPFIKND